METTRKPVAVIVSDTHYSLSTLALADSAWRMAVDKAHELGVHLIDSGDITNDKAILRAEVVNAMLDTMEYASRKGVPVTLLVGNHSLINEKGKEHALNFLASYCNIIDSPVKDGDFYFVPYQANADDFPGILSRIPKGSTIIMHQGVTGAESGEYVYDKSAINKDLLADYRVISGHYHLAQDIKCGRPRKGAVGLMSYIGSPYTITYAEANDGPKGFRILYDDGALESVPTNLRKHIITEGTLTQEALTFTPFVYNKGDLLWVKLKGTTLELDKVKKPEIAKMLGIDHTSFKLDKIVTDGPKVLDKEVEEKDNSQIMDLIIDRSQESQERKTYLKKLWRTL